MLSTTANGLYWLSRYLERAEFTTRLLSVQFEALEDLTVEEIDESWKRLYGTMRQEPVGGFQSNLGEELFMLTDSFTLTDELTFDLDNSNSICSCIAAGRENARVVRNVIGSEMWSRLNAIHLDLQSVDLFAIWKDQPRKFFLRLEDDFRTLSGITDHTMYRDHGWHFTQLGRFIERVQMVAALLNAQVSIDRNSRNFNESSWLSILKVCEARVAYFRVYSLAYEPTRVLRFVIGDPVLPNSIRFSLQKISQSLSVVADGHFSAVSAEAVECNQSIIRQVESFETRMTNVHDLLQNLLDSAYKLHENITLAFFQYDLENILRKNA